MVRAGGGTPAGARDAARSLVAGGVDGLVSFGLAGGLDPALRPGVVVVPAAVYCDGVRYQTDIALSDRFGGLTGHLALASSQVVADAGGKYHLHQTTGAHLVDLESGAVARVAQSSGLPFIIVRAICDPAERTLPPAALVALDRKGGIGLIRVIDSVLRQPGQLRSLVRLAQDAQRARRALLNLAVISPA